MIICTGEILVDMVGRMNNGILQYDRHAGGAPFNVCSAIAKFGGESIFYGTVLFKLIYCILCAMHIKCK